METLGVILFILFVITRAFSESQNKKRHFEERQRQDSRKEVECQFKDSTKSKNLESNKKNNTTKSIQKAKSKPVINYSNEYLKKTTPLSFSKNEILQGIILSEILESPKSVVRYCKYQL